MRSIVNPAQLIDLVSLLQIDFLEIHRMKTSANSEKMRWWNWLAIVVVAELLGVSEAMTPAEQTEIVVKHNELRRLAKASNMEHMKWNTYLASLAAEWAANCTFMHGGQPPENAQPYNSVGQNLYMTSMNTVDLNAAVQKWYDEIKDYTYDTLACPKDKMCGHYTQVIWAESREVGCAYVYCDQLKGTILVCNYGPPGNMEGAKPFKKGAPCTQCPSGKGWCDNGLCRRDCQPSDNCECKATCANCGTLDKTQCSCTCAKGWTGPDCTRKCADYHKWCGANPGWPKNMCNNPTYSVMLDKCLLLCGLCEAEDPNAKCDQTTMKTTTTTSTTTTTATPTKTNIPTILPTTKTTTTATSTTTTVAPSTPCGGVTCQNGGTSYVEKDMCKCRCTADWQGTNCEESRAQARVGVILRVRAPIVAWEKLWRVIKSIVVHNVNTYCNHHVMTCCPGAGVTVSGGNLEFTTSAQLRVGDGYPQTLQARGREFTMALIYATGAPNNVLCAAFGGQRRRRAISAGPPVPQDVLLKVVESARQNLTEQMSSCCNASLDDVSAAVVAPDPTNDPVTENGFPKWAIPAVIGAGVIASMVVFVAAFAMAVAYRSKRKSAPALTEAKPSRHAMYR